MADTRKIEELIAALGAHDMYNPETRVCRDGTEWCMDYILRSLQPATDDGPAMPTVMLGPVGGIALASVFLWPAYIGARLWISLWTLIPRLFGYHFTVTVVHGQARSRLLRRSR